MLIALQVLIFVVAGHAESEVQACQRLAPKYAAETEVRLWDGTRVDLLNDQYAIEADWAPKWAEAIGQSLYYAELTGRRPGIVLLVTDIDRERRYVYRCQTVCARHGIRLWVEASIAQAAAAPPAMPPGR